MEQTVLRPKPMPGRESGEGRPSGTARRPHAAPRRARQRLITLLFALFGCAALVLSGVGLGTMGATVIGMSRLAEPRESAPDGDGRTSGGVPKSAAGSGSSVTAPTGAPIGAPTRPTLGVEVVDAPGGAAGSGARVVGVHVPGPGYSAGLVRGDTVLALGGTRTGSAADLARAVTAARPGVAMRLLVRHANGTRRHLVAVPGVVT
ncbi:PDZ domain-containing protein [Streptomyces griseiscabiei]|uniref:PDZ domain-containing protein n=1 Tax=Streptomyces griseiscabiei TaxID=2993540 RepID=A0ABU4KYH2_9ACTN|nr:PDZ domain-containing protein [Streptomyces griseiscabiei]MBZ3904665.1 PDZ domain-containing protein [Streptomyces griseiscabiei]MDX2908414.1 PDZ domain-containing protein [Streptomyces griseiscabiei]